MSKKGTSLRYFSEENAGFKIQPKTVLIMSLIYIGLVVLLHIYSKLGSSKPNQSGQATPTVETNAKTQQAQTTTEDTL